MLLGIEVGDRVVSQTDDLNRTDLIIEETNRIVSNENRNLRPIRRVGQTDIETETRIPISMDDDFAELGDLFSDRIDFSE